MLKLIKNNIRGQIRNFILLIILIVTLNYIRSLVPLFIGDIFRILKNEDKSHLPHFISSLLTGDKKNMILIVCLLLLLVYLVRELVNIAADLLVTVVSEGVGIKVQRKFFSHVSNLNYSYLSNIETGDLIQRATNDINKFKNFCGGTLPRLFGNLLLIFFFSYQMFRIDFTISLFVTIAIPILLLVSIIYFALMQKHFVSIENAEGKMTTVVQENLTGIRVVKAFANQEFECQKFDQSMQEMKKHWNKINRNSSFFWSITDVLIIMQIAFTFVLSIKLVVDGDLTASSAISILLLAQNVLWPVRNLGRQLSEFSRTSIACKRINEILEIPDEYQNDSGATNDIKGDIEFKDVSFFYPKAELPALSNINLKIKSGETIALIGKTGSGKSTLVNLINRMNDPSAGQILVDGRPTSEYQKRALRSQIGIVMQEPFLYSRTIKENINITNKKAGMEEIVEVAQIAAVDADIEHFKDKYDTLVGERGVTLSGGQKQRLAIARILIKPYPILIFDDSLSAVDTETDLKIRTALKSRQAKATTIVITHRIQTAMDADYIVVLDQGKVSDIGKHHELIRRPGLYQTIYNIQNAVSEGAGE